MSNYAKYNLSKDFEKLKTLLFIQPKQRSQENLREIQLCLKKNRAFHCLPNEVQLQLCQTAIYQEFEAESMLLRQGHVLLECYLILAGHLKVMSSNTSMNKNTNSEILSEFEEGNFIGVEHWLRSWPSCDWLNILAGGTSEALLESYDPLWTPRSSPGSAPWS